MEVTTDEPAEGPRGAEVKAAFSSGVEGADDDEEEDEVPRMEDMEKFPGPFVLKLVVN